MRNRWTLEQYEAYVNRQEKAKQAVKSKPKVRKEPKLQPNTTGMDKPSKGFSICHSTLQKKSTPREQDSNES